MTKFKAMLSWLNFETRKLGARLRPSYVVLTTLAVGLQAYLMSIGAFDLLYAHTRAHEDWELDEWLSGSTDLTTALQGAFPERNFRQYFSAHVLGLSRG